MVSYTNNLREQADPFTKAKIQLVLHHPFFAVLVMHLQTIPVTAEWLMMNGSPPTAAVDGRHMFYNDEWVRTLPDEQRLGLLAHEGIHPAHGHLWRRGNREKDIWDIACDFVDNLIVTHAGMQLPPGCLLDSKFDGMSVEQVYALLYQKAQKGGKGKDKSEEGSGSGSGEGKGGKGKGKGKDDRSDGHLEKVIQQPSDGKKKPEKPEDKGKGKDPQDEPGQPGQSDTPDGAGNSADALSEEWKMRLIQAALTAKAKGKLPAGMDRLITELTTPKVCWQQIVERFCNDIVRDDYDMQRQDRRFLEQGIYFPELQSTGIEIGVFVDTSGSIGKKELEAWVSEAVGIIRCRQVKGVRIMACDARVTLDEYLHPQDPLPENYPGGGGTSFIPPFDRLAKEGMRPALVVYLTDSFGDYPKEEPPYPVIWVIGKKPWMTEEQLNMPPWGMSVIMELEGEAGE